MLFRSLVPVAAVTAAVVYEEGEDDEEGEDESDGRKAGQNQQGLAEEERKEEGDKKEQRGEGQKESKETWRIHGLCKSMLDTDVDYDSVVPMKSSLL